jgi:hypothetical protein
MLSFPGWTLPFEISISVVSKPDSHKMKLHELWTLTRAPFPGCGTDSNILVHLMTLRIPTAVVEAEAIRFHRWKTRMKRSCPGVAIRGLPLLGGSLDEPVCWNLFHSREMVLWLTFRVRATSFCDCPALSSTESNRFRLNHCSRNTWTAKNHLANSPQPASTAWH